MIRPSGTSGSYARRCRHGEDDDSGSDAKDQVKPEGFARSALQSPQWSHLRAAAERVVVSACVLNRDGVPQGILSQRAEWLCRDRREACGRHRYGLCSIPRKTNSREIRG